MNRKTWTIDECDVLKQHYRYMSVDEIGFLLDRSASSIIKKAGRLGLNKFIQEDSNSRECVKCRTWQSIDQFYEGKTSRSHCKRCRRQYQISMRRDYRRQCLEHYSNNTMMCMCPGCEENTDEFLCIDHVANDGAQHRRETNGYARALTVWLVRNGLPDGFQVLCYNCNMAKGIYGRCPHEV